MFNETEVIAYDYGYSKHIRRLSNRAAFFFV